MKIISGFLKGRTLKGHNIDGTRPTMDRVKESLFGIIQNYIKDSTVLDLFAGSGAMGLEAASRGAAIVYSVEKDARHVQVIEKNIRKVQKTGVETTFNTIHSDILNMKKIASQIDEVDLIFADPPYDISAELFNALAEDKNFLQLAENSLIVWEIPDIPGSVGQFISKKEIFSSFNFRKFGSTAFLIAEL